MVIILPRSLPGGTGIPQAKPPETFLNNILDLGGGIGNKFDITGGFLPIGGTAKTSIDPNEDQRQRDFEEMLKQMTRKQNWHWSVWWWLGKYGMPTRQPIRYGVSQEWGL